ncbi:adenosylcobinamide-phosphate synthase CbiB [Bhargavaea cecembensis]|uniref:adenosylcobinamide-phosphate synthase CbiB n=1 Tax=Bhargavaea cecembensis TaxID=394098 RepID=UPI000AEDACB3|nr:adenosylcobinamide-phosphate synthase CbiB [Bhargavaea cecembensis]
MILNHLIACAAGFLIDRLIGDPPGWPHPVRWIGRMIGFLDSRLNQGGRRRAKGLLLLFLVAGMSVLAALAVSSAFYQVHRAAGITAESLMIAAGLAQKSLGQAAMDVYGPLKAEDLPEARKKLGWIVGRDTDRLDEPEIVRGVVETVSENTSDGVTAPLFWAFLLGAPGIWLYKAVNTLDSMVGYRNEKHGEFGFFSAKADDVLNVVPARLTGGLILLFTRCRSGLPLGTRLARWRRDARRHPSPNSGWLEAATACQLGVELGGLNYYKGVPSARARMGVPLRPLAADDILESVKGMHAASAAFLVLLMVIGGVIFVFA